MPESFGSHQRLVRPRHRWDWVLALDPGLADVQASLRTVVSLIVGFSTGFGMAHALGLPIPPGVALGGVMGLVSALIIAENTAKGLAIALLWMPFPASAALTLGAWLHPHRVLEMWLVVATLALFFYLPRYRTPGMVSGVSVFAFFLYGMTTLQPLSNCGLLAAEAGTIAVALLAARLLLCPPRPRKDLLRTQRAFVIESRRVLGTSADVLSSHARRTGTIRRMRRAQHRLNVMTMIIEGRLAMPEVAADPSAAELLHRRLFDAEAALHGIGETVLEISGRRVPRALREALETGLRAARDAHLDKISELRPITELIHREADAFEEWGRGDAEVRVLAHRIGDLLESLTDALTAWLRLGWSTPASGAAVPYQAAVVLDAGGRPSGMAAAARRSAAVEHGRGWRSAVSPHLRAPLQATVGAAVMLPIGDAISPNRFYWGLIGVLLSLMGPMTVTERVRKTAQRAGGTALGAALGIILLHLIGRTHDAVLVMIIVVCVGMAVLGAQHRYFFFVTFLTVALVQIYAMSTPDSGIDWLLTQRVLENGIGMVVGTFCACLLYPLATRKVVREAQRGYLTALEQLLARVADRWTTPAAPARPRGAARAVDAALYQIRSAMRPVIGIPALTWDKNEHMLALLSAAAGHARSLAVAADADIDLDPRELARAGRIVEILTASLRELDRQVAGPGRRGTWTRISPLVHGLESAVAEGPAPATGPLRVALGELTALDEVLATLAEIRGMRVTVGQVEVPARV